MRGACVAALLFGCTFTSTAPPAASVCSQFGMGFGWLAVLWEVGACALSGKVLHDDVR